MNAVIDHATPSRYATWRSTTLSVVQALAIVSFCAIVVFGMLMLAPP
jgi:hypothetical protein